MLCFPTPHSISCFSHCASSIATWYGMVKANITEWISNWHGTTCRFSASVQQIFPLSLHKEKGITLSYLLKKTYTILASTQQRSWVQWPDLSHQSWKQAMSLVLWPSFQSLVLPSNSLGHQGCKQATRPVLWPSSKALVLHSCESPELQASFLGSFFF